MQRLTRRQALFVEEYFVDFNGAAAAERAGYSGNGAAQSAHKMMKLPHVMAAIDARQAKLIETTNIRREWVMEELRKQVVRSTAEGTKTYNPSAANKALELLGKEIGMFVDRRMLGITKIEDMSEEEILELLGGEPPADELEAASLHSAGNA